jgi:hypothetical protein
MPARLLLEAGDWSGAATLALTPAKEAYSWQKYPQTKAVNAFARGIGAAGSGNAAAAHEQQARLVALRDAARTAQLPYWAGQIDIQAAIVGALALCAGGKTDDCISELKAAAAREGATEKHVVTPGPLLPARELLAETLLAARKPAEALAEYDSVMKKEPNRYRAIAGALAAARAGGDDMRARAFAGSAPRRTRRATACARRRRSARDRPTHGIGLVSDRSAQRFCCSLKITGKSSRNRRSMRGSVEPLASVQAVVWESARSFRQ